MLIEVYDDDAPAVVWLFCGDTNSDDDFERWLSSMDRLGRAQGHRKGAILLVIDPENPPPAKAFRDRVASVARASPNTMPYAVVTSSAVARTLIAGLHLARVVGFPLKGFATVDDAVDWLVKGSSETMRPALSAMIAEARAKQSLRQN